MTKITTASRKTLSLLLAMLMAFSCLAIAAGATEIGTFVLNGTNCVLDIEKKTITVPKSTVNVDGVPTVINFAIDSKTASTVVDKDGNTVFFNLEAGKSYVVSASVVPGGVGDAVPVCDPYTVKLKKSQNAPAEPVPVNATSTSIEIKSVAGAEYACIVKNSDKLPVYAKETEFKGLVPETEYVIYIRYAETTEAYASSSASITITTLKASSGEKAPAPVLADKTDASITVVKFEGYEYSIDGGKTWQANPTFKGLKADTSYSIICRKSFDTEVEEPTTPSDAIVVITTKRTPYDASIDKCTIKRTSDDPVYAESTFEFIVSCDGPADLNDVVYGDTRFIPYSYENDQVEGVKYFSTSSNKAVSSTAASGTLTLKVKFLKQKFTGAEWVGVALESKTLKVTVSPKLNMIFNFFSKIANVFLNTIPAAINKFLTGGSLKKIVDAITNFGK